MPTDNAREPRPNTQRAKIMEREKALRRAASRVPLVHYISSPRSEKNMDSQKRVRESLLCESCPPLFHKLLGRKMHSCFLVAERRKFGPAGEVIPFAHVLRF